MCPLIVPEFTGALPATSTSFPQTSLEKFRTSSSPDKLRKLATELFSDPFVLDDWQYADQRKFANLLMISI